MMLQMILIMIKLACIENISSSCRFLSTIVVLSADHRSFLEFESSDVLSFYDEDEVSACMRVQFYRL